MTWTIPLGQIAEDAKAKAGLISSEALLQEATTLGDIVALSSNEDSYRNSLRSAVRGFWKGKLDYDLFFDAMIAAIRLFLPRAWYEGAESVGIKPAELSPEEKTAMEAAVQSETNHINDLAVAIEANKEADGKLTPLFSRLDMWIGRYSDLRSRARLMAEGDPKLMWVMHPEKEHCHSCLRLHLKVKRASYWKRVGVQPKNPPNEKLECGGWKCGCELQPTDLRCSPGPLPATLLKRELHIGPGAHPGTGTPQAVHGRGGGKAPPTSSKFGKGVLDEATFSRSELDKISKATRPLPQEHLGAVASLRQGKPQTPMARGECGANGDIVLSDEEPWDEGSVVHEVGHAVSNHNTRGITYAADPQAAMQTHEFKFSDFYYDKVYAHSEMDSPAETIPLAGRLGVLEKGFPSAYSQISPGELFAESYMMYTQSPKALQARAMDLYEYMRDNVFDGAEYTE